MTCKPYDIPKTLIWEAWLHVKANQGAAGIDAETIERFEKKLGDNLYKLWNRMSSGSYLPPPVKAVEIPKASGRGFENIHHDASGDTLLRANSHLVEICLDAGFVIFLGFSFVERPLTLGTKLLKTFQKPVHLGSRCGR